MESFYGGRQGDSIKIVAHYTDTLETQVKTVNGEQVRVAGITAYAVDNMMDDFRRGALSLDKVAYGEYVLIETSYEGNENNGNIYRRGFDYEQAATYKIRPEAAIKVGFRKPLAQRTVYEIDSVVQERLTLASDYAKITDDELAQHFSIVTKTTESGDTVDYYYFLDSELYQDYVFPATYIKAIEVIDNTELDIQSTAYTGALDGYYSSHKILNSFYLYQGAGAEYMGRILGPIGKTPTVEIGHYEEISKLSEDLNVVKYSNELGDNLVSEKDLYEATANDDDNKIYISWVNVEDQFGNVSGCKVGFKIPYPKFTFNVSARDPYYTLEEASLYEGAYEGNIIQDDKSSFLATYNGETSKPFYHEWDLQVLKGIKGDSLEKLSVNNEGLLTACYRYYDNKAGGEKRYEDIGNVGIVEEFSIDDEGNLLVKYLNNDASPVSIGNVRKNNIANINNFYNIFKIDKSKNNAGKLVTALNNAGTKIEKDAEGNETSSIIPLSPSLLYGYNIVQNDDDEVGFTVSAKSSSSSEDLDQSLVGHVFLVYSITTTSGVTVGQYSVKADEEILTLSNITSSTTTSETTCDSWLVAYNYTTSEWESIQLASDGAVADPARILTSYQNEVDDLSPGGYYLGTDTVFSVYDAIGTTDFGVKVPIVPNIIRKNYLKEVGDGSITEFDNYYPAIIATDLKGNTTIKALSGYGYHWWETNSTTTTNTTEA